MAQFYADLDRAFPRNRHGRLRLAPIPATIALVLVNLMAYWADLYFSGTESRRILEDWGHLDPDAVWSGEWWRLITHSFVHADGEHLGWNLVWLILFCYLVEPALGWFRTFTVYLVSAVAAGLVCLIIDPAPSLGASDAIYAFNGVYLALLWRTPGSWLRPQVALPRWFWTLMTPCFISGGWGDPEVGYLAHLVGLVTGIWYGCALPVRRSESRRVWQSLRLRHASLGVSLVMATMLMLGAFWQPDWWYARAQSALEDGDWITAEEHLLRLEQCAIPTLYNDAYALAQASRLYWRFGRQIHALELIEQSAPYLDDPLAYVSLGNLQFYISPPREQDALASYRQALALDNQCVDALTAMSDLCVMATDSLVYDPEKARRLAKQAVKLTRAAEPYELWTLAEAQFECGNTREAIRLMERALRLKPEDPGNYVEALSEMKANAGDVLSDLPGAGSQSPGADS
jgi:membrane associated rhomboid family serine protease